MENLLHAFVGIAGLSAIAWLASENRRAVPWLLERTMGVGGVVGLSCRRRRRWWFRS